MIRIAYWAIAVGALGIPVCTGCSDATSELGPPNVHRGSTVVDGGAKPQDPDAGGAVTPDGASPQPAIPFATCPLKTGGTDTDAECANIELPLDWREPEGKKIAFFLKRLRGKTTPRRQLWLLEGGPGGAGDGYDDIARVIAAEDPSLDIYIPDHRGTGRSTFFDCKTQSAKSLDSEQDYKACFDELKATWGDKLGGFSTTNAARDVGELIARTREPGQEVHVYGSSYGTIWGHRYLQLYPTQATAITLDSICPPGGLCSPLKYWYWGNEIGKKFMDECRADAFCAGKLGPDPYAKMKAALDVVEKRTCSGTSTITRDAMRDAFAKLLMDQDYRVLVPALIHRIARCNAEDVAALNHFADTLRKANDDHGGRAASLYSDLLNLHIAFSEMEEEPPATTDALRALDADVLFGTIGPDLRALYDAWPRYSRDEHVGKYATTATPMLMLNGTLDPQTPFMFADEFAKHFTGEAQTYVSVPRATHGVIGYGPIGALPCGRELFYAFLKDPRAKVDPSCTAKLPPIDFRGDARTAQDMFATDSIWGATASREGVIDRSEADLLRVLRGPKLPRFVRNRR